MFRRRRWLTDAETGWFRPDGEAMREQDWHSAESRAVVLYLDGGALDEIDELGWRCVVDSAAAGLEGQKIATADPITVTAFSTLVLTAPSIVQHDAQQ